MIWELVGGFSGLLRALAGALIAWGLFSVWLGLWHDPRVRDDARREYVAIVAEEVAKAKAEERERQQLAAAQLLEEYRKRLASVLSQDAIDDARHDKEIADYEKRLAAAGRASQLDDADIEFLLKP